MARANKRCASVFAATVVACAAASPVSAALITEDFDYTYVDGNSHLGGASGGAGFTAAWTNSTTRVYIHPGDLTYSNGGYDITQAAGTKAGTGLNAQRGLYRDFTALTGDVWFSFLVQNTAGAGSASPYVAVQWQTSGVNNTTLYDNYIQFKDGAINVNYNATLTSNVVTGLARNTTHLIVGRWTVGAGNDGLDVWVNPANLNALGAANFSDASADVMSSLTRIGVMGVATSSGSPLVFVDAIRISDGSGSAGVAFGDVTGVPEPGVLGLAVAGLAMAGRRRARHE